MTFDVSDTTASLTRTFSHTLTNASVIVADGWGVRVHVHDGRLSDGVGRHRRVRTFERVDRTVRRLVVIARSGYLTLDALTWCRRVGTAITLLDPDTLAVTAVPVAAHDDARLRRVQALAAGTALGDDVVRELLTAKINGQAQLAASALGSPETAAYLASATSKLVARDVGAMRSVEADAASVYFGAWVGQSVRFARRDQERVPSRWHRYDTRVSLITGVNRVATNPINAMMNYLFAVAESEAVLACSALGLDPGLGVLHADALGRNSMALDLLEPIRPAVESYVLELVRSRVFRRVDFAESPEGRCFLLPELAQELAGTGPRWAELLGPVTERVAATFAAASAGSLTARTPLTQSKRQRSTSTYHPPKHERPQRRCIECGEPVASRRAVRCPSCWSAVAAEHYRRLGAQRVETMARLRAERGDPTATPVASAKRSAGQVRNRAALAAWRVANPDAPELGDPTHFRSVVLPKLENLRAAHIAAVLSVSTSAASRIKSGVLVPHVRHWAVLEGLSESTRL